MDAEALLRRHKKRPLYPFEQGKGNVHFTKDDIEKIIPHRDPFLFVDCIVHIDLEKETIIGTRTIKRTDPVFKGHFPDFPVYPGSLVMEMIGQLGFCLHYFLSHKTTSIIGGTKPAAVRATKVLGAHFIEPVLPGKEVVLLAQKIEQDEFFGTMIGQAVLDGKICAVGISEFYLP